ncbi:MAG: DEAD/DEAH box helicase family protein [bacterium]
MSAKLSLTQFQQSAVESGVAALSHARSLFDAATEEVSRRTVAARNGCLLIEAPTGSGKTLMAGQIVERVSAGEKVVWFWFAPFKGVIGQTKAFLGDQFAGLRLRELVDDRNLEDSEAGDVFVTTWQTVATRVLDRRNVRKVTENTDSVDMLVQKLRERGFRIGVVVDEAHHSFHGQTQAGAFFREILAPEYALLITATPDDKMLETFEEKMGIVPEQRIRIGREDAVEAGLIKAGVRCAAYVIEPEKARLVDLEGLALRDAVAAHRGIKTALAEAGADFTPLLLVQVDSREDEADARTEKSVQRVKEKLLKLGFTEEQIAVHTAKEPDDGLLALAHDMTREVLVFKMAVALGFDAPRAFTLVSMRATRDPDFGVQLVGRILRVHRQLQAAARKRTLPERLRYGYVFLADPSTQEGLDIAGQRINQIKTEYAQVCGSTVLIQLGGGISVQHAPDGQPVLFPTADEYGNRLAADATGDEPKNQRPVEPFELTFDFARLGVPETGATPSSASEGSADQDMSVTSRIQPITGRFRYPLRTDVPKRFKTVVAMMDNETTEEDCANRFVVSARDLLEAIAGRINVQRRTLEVFTHQLEFDLVGADLNPSELARLAEKILFASTMFDAKALREVLEHKVSAMMKEWAIAEGDDDEAVARFLDTLLARHPELLKRAQKAAISATLEVRMAADLPGELVSDAGLPSSARNIYGVYPERLNGWERAFAQWLDGDTLGVVCWWHRNPQQQPWSVNVPRPDGRGFFPDFVVGINGRKTEEGALLADPKWAFDRHDEAPKAGAHHPSYGNVLVLCRDQDIRWMTVRYDVERDIARIDREFFLSDAAGF